MAKGKRRSIKSPANRGRRKSGSQSASSLNAESPRQDATPVTNGTLSEPPPMEQIPESANDTSEGAAKEKVDDLSVSSALCKSPDKDEEETEPKSEPTSVVRRLSRWVSGRFGASHAQENGITDGELPKLPIPEQEQEEQVPDDEDGNSLHAVEENGSVCTPQKPRGSGVWTRVKDVFYTPFSPRVPSLDEVEEEETKENGEENIKDTEEIINPLKLCRSPPRLRMLNNPASGSEEPLTTATADRKRRSIFSYTYGSVACTKKRKKQGEVDQLDSTVHEPVDDTKKECHNPEAQNAGGIVPNVISPSALKHIEWMEKVFDAKVEKLYWSDANGSSQILTLDEVRNKEGGRILHAAVEINQGKLYLADHLKSSGYPELLVKPSDEEVKKGCGVMFHLDLGDEIQSIWDKAVSAEAAVLVGLHVQAGGATYGVLVDPYGLEWSVSSPKSQENHAKLDISNERE